MYLCVLLIIGLWLQQQDVAASSPSPRIVIVGAGMSGLSAAERLQQKGLTNYIILEASDRIGGRINTIPFGNGWVEMGAQWLHGDQNNVVYDYAIQHDLVHPQAGLDSFNYTEFVTDSKWPIDKNFSRDLFQYLSDKMEDLSSDTPGDMTLDEYLQNATDQLPRGSNVEESYKKKFLQWFDKYTCIAEACNSLSELTVNNSLRYDELQGDNAINLRHGFTAVINSIADSIPVKTILLNMPVVKIQLNNATNDNKPLVVIGLDGSRHEADHVIVTTSLGVLKHNATGMFDPPLPETKLKAIENIGFGTVNKIFLDFKQPFWPNTTTGYNLVWLFEGAPSPMWNRWHHAIVGFYTVPFAQNVLCGWIAGEEAIFMETQNDLQVQATSLGILQSFSKQQYMPGVNSMKRSNWFSNEFFRGSYSYFNKKSQESNVSNADLATPIYITESGHEYPAILFAGEATHDNRYSTAHGARETGIREANRIIEFYGNMTGSSSNNSKWCGTKSWVIFIILVTLAMTRTSNAPDLL